MSKIMRLRFFNTPLVCLSALLGIFLLGACAPDEGTETQQAFPTFNCEAGEPDWVLAKAFSPDVVLPCNAGSTGICKTGYTYVSGTGWCKPGEPTAASPR